MDVFEQIDDAAIEEERQALNYINPDQRKDRVVKGRPDNFNTWDDREFWRRFRLKKQTVELLLSLIQDKIEHNTERNQCVPPMHQLLLALRFYATGTFYVTIGDFGGLHNSTICKIVKRVTKAIATLRPNFVNLPENREEIIAIQERFHNIARFPRVIAAIDCTHIKIMSPGGDTAENYRNRKGFFSLNVQAMCTANLQFVDIVARWPGSSHDSLIFNNSAAKYRCDRGDFGNGIVLGDSGYFLNNYLLTPLSNPRTQVEQLYNESHIRSRNVIERCFGVWKRRFPVLSIGLRCKIPLAQDVIVAAAILHNLACSQSEGEPPSDPEVLIPQQPEFPPVYADNEGINSTSSTRDGIINYFESLITQ
ncbi:putative nuclease HARBI1 [Helicoverpa armigera]|uniref:putative nuclease HARBI1 n=1 Tax=Helicoverpa armigera TaxID=29058 RepID=UPI00308296F8